MKTIKTKLLLLFILSVLSVALAAPVEAPPLRDRPVPETSQSYKVKCSHCGTSARLKPASSWTDRHYTANSVKVSKTLNFKCAKEGCAKEFTQSVKPKFVKK
jgi:hypothetical protein